MPRAAGPDSEPAAPAAVVGVVGVSGGCGASTLAAAIAVQAAAAGAMVALVDGQPGGAGLDVHLAAEHVAGVRWPDLAAVDGAVDGTGLLSRLPVVPVPRAERGGAAGGLAVLAHGRDGAPCPGASARRGVVEGLARARGVDLVVVDSGRWEVAGAEQAWPWEPDLVVLVSGSGLVELAALAAGAATVGPQVAETVVVLRGRRARAVCGDVEEAIGLPVVGLLPDDPGVLRDVEAARLPGRRGVLAELAGRLGETVLRGRGAGRPDRREGGIPRPAPGWAS